MNGLGVSANNKTLESYSSDKAHEVPKFEFMQNSCTEELRLYQQLLS